ncbi:Serine/Threonine protein kinase [Reticulomyxa filosa]|uniref:Serine/Threonine protein kinase n=1 Tax=Reticulomyxa filosa TaxID=46433 RepID=X6MPJ4_RETFI|nr:Serine/Threonine protein kinase [Reticulomyxa filosa]|eukprot:ETO15005.1 Serine/Threonine protein kinase [Reticulomyxa filosa]
MVDVETFKLLHIFSGDIKTVRCVAFSSLQSKGNNDNESNSIGVIGGNGYTICSGSDDKIIRVFDIETTKQLTLFKGHGDWVNSIKYGSNELGISGGANTILSGSNDHSVRLWDIMSKFKYSTDIKVEYVLLNTHHFSNVICSGSDDNTIRFWDIRSNKKELYMIKGDDQKDVGILSLKFQQIKQKEKVNKINDDINLCYGSYGGFIHFWG